MHGIDDMELVAQHVGQFTVDQCLGNDADDVAARAPCRSRNGAHQARAATTIDQLAALLADPVANGFCHCGMHRRVARTGSAIDADGKSMVHVCIMP